MATPPLNTIGRHIKQETLESDDVFNKVPQEEQHPSYQQQQWEQQLMKFTSDLTSLSVGICNFKRSFHNLHNSLDQIQNSILSIVTHLQQQQHLHHHQTPHTNNPTQSATDNNVSTTTTEPGKPPPPPPPPPPPQTITQAQSAKANTSIENAPPLQESESCPGTEATDLAEAGPEPQYCSDVKPWWPAIDALCKRMFARGVRKYITRNLSHPNLRQDVIAALMLAPNPAQLVLQCVGNCYMQAPKCRSKDQHKMARVLILEYFLLMTGGCVAEGLEIEIQSSTVEKEAKQVAVLWRSRMIKEGGVGNASEVDARGLLLLLACFGIPPNFTDEDLVTLSCLCNIKEILNALKGSRVLPARLPGIIDGMTKNGSYAEAIEFARSFGIEEKFPPQAILTTFLQRYFSSPVTLKQSKGKQLAAVKSVVKFVEDQGWDLEKICDRWPLKEKIVNLEKDISHTTNNLGNPKSIGRGKKMRKRKLGEARCSSKVVMSEEMKRPCIAVRDPLIPTSPGVNRGSSEQQLGVVTLADGPPKTASCKDAFHSSHLSNNASASAVSHTSAAHGVGSHAAAVHEHGARDAAGSFYARPSLRQPQPQGGISVVGNVVPGMMGGQGHGLHLQYGWNGHWGSVVQRTPLNHASMVATGGGYYYAPLSSDNNHQQPMAPYFI